MSDGRLLTLGIYKYLDSGDANTDVSGLNHANIIRTIANGKQNRFLVLLDKLNDEGFLERGHTA